MNRDEALKIIRETDRTSHYYYHAMSILSVDGVTAAPKQSWRGRAETTGFLSGQVWELTNRPEFAEALELLKDDKSLPKEDARLVELLRESMEEIRLFTRDEFVARQQLLTEADNYWHEAKEKSDYSLFAPYLEKLIRDQKELARRKDASKQPYDVLLDMYEKGTSTRTLDPFFELISRDLRPVVKQVADAPQPRVDFLHRVYPIHLQRVFSDRVMALMSIDRERCSIGETEHPFTDGVNKWDVRITTKYLETDVASSLYSVIHEGGHALYEMGVRDEYQFTSLAGGSSMGLHESQSRFYENLIGRSRAFTHALFPICRELFPEQTADVTEEEWYRAVNLSRPSLVRTEADELTYPFHVMIRYELEKQMINGDVPVSELPGMWNELYRKELGVIVPNDREGILQDSHWSGGAFGYFPSYALGSAYGVQMLESMNREMNVEDLVKQGDLAPVTAWLQKRIHQYGRSLTPAQLLESADVSPFEPEKYTRYLREKFTSLYNL